MQNAEVQFFSPPEWKEMEERDAKMKANGEPTLLRNDKECEGLELDLQNQLQSAFEEHRQGHQQTIDAFLLRIAGLCEGGKYSAPSVARAIHKLDSTDRSCSGLVSLDTLQAGGDSGGSANKPNEPPRSPRSATPRSCTGPDMAARAKARALVVGDSTAQYTSDELSKKEEIAHEFEVPVLDFLDRKGAIKEAPSRMAKVVDHGWWSEHRCCQPMSGRLRKIVDGAVVKATSALMISINFIFIIAVTDYKMYHARDLYHKGVPLWMNVVESAFTTYYVIELISLVIVHRKDFFIGKDAVWNAFDTIVVGVSGFEVLSYLAGVEGVNLSFLRILKFLKVSRILRIFSAVRMFKEIRIMLDALTGSLAIFTFCSVLLAMFLSLFSIVFVQALTTYREDNYVSPAFEELIMLDFGTVTQAMLSLLMSITGGNDWITYQNTLKEVSWVFQVLYVFFIVFAQVAFFNVMTGVYAEKAMSLALPTMDQLMQRRQEHEKRDAKELILLLQSVFPDYGSSEFVITEANLLLFMSNPRVYLYLEVRGLKQVSTERFFKLLMQVNGKNEIDIGTFVSAFVKLDGSAASIDVQVLCVEAKTSALQQQHLLRLLSQTLAASQQTLTRIETQEAKEHAMLTRLEAEGGREIELLKKQATEVSKLRKSLTVLELGTPVRGSLTL